MTWTPGQQAVINRQTVVTIDRVTPAGRAVANGRTFDVDGRERVAGDPYKRPKLEPLTPEIQAEMALVKHGRIASGALYSAIHNADCWQRKAFSTWGYRVPDIDDVDRAERLAAAILSNLPTPPAKEPE
jgi:hypothetical protein